MTNTKLTILKWLLVLFIISLLPPLFYIIGVILFYGLLLNRMIDIFGTMLRMPKWRTLIGIAKRQYMINKSKMKGVPVSSTTSSPLSPSGQSSAVGNAKTP